MPWLLLVVDLPCLLFECPWCECELGWLLEWLEVRTSATRALALRAELEVGPDCAVHAFDLLLVAMFMLVRASRYDVGSCTLLIESETVSIVLLDTLSEKPQTLYELSM